MSLDAKAIFEQELEKRGLTFERDGEHLYRLQLGDTAVVVNLENARRNAERDGDPDAIHRFVKRILHLGSGSELSWQDASELLFLSAEASDHEFGDTIRSPVSDEFCRVLTLTDREQSHVSWVSQAMCSDWGVTPDQAVAAALRNQDALIAGLSIEVEAIDGHKLGMVPLDSPYKASVIFAPSFRTLVAQDFGWPVWVVIPCRDFIYVIAENSELVPRLGGVVQREFRGSGYPITTEVLRVASDGIEAIGTFPK